MPKEHKNQSSLNLDAELATNNKSENLLPKVISNIDLINEWITENDNENLSSRKIENKIHEIQELIKQINTELIPTSDEESQEELVSDLESLCTLKNEMQELLVKSINLEKKIFTAANIQEKFKYSSSEALKEDYINENLKEEKKKRNQEFQKKCETSSEKNNYIFNQIKKLEQKRKKITTEINQNYLEIWIKNPHDLEKLKNKYHQDHLERENIEDFLKELAKYHITSPNIKTSLEQLQIKLNEKIAEHALSSLSGDYWLNKYKQEISDQEKQIISENLKMINEKINLEKQQQLLILDKDIEELKETTFEYYQQQQLESAREKLSESIKKDILNKNKKLAKTIEEVKQKKTKWEKNFKSIWSQKMPSECEEKINKYTEKLNKLNTQLQIEIDIRLKAEWLNQEKKLIQKLNDEYQQKQLQNKKITAENYKKATEKWEIEKRKELAKKFDDDAVTNKIYLALAAKKLGIDNWEDVKKIFADIKEEFSDRSDDFKIFKNYHEKKIITLKLNQAKEKLVTETQKKLQEIAQIEAELIKQIETADLEKKEKEQKRKKAATELQKQEILKKNQEEIKNKPEAKQKQLNNN